MYLNIIIRVYKHVVSTTRCVTKRNNIPTNDKTQIKTTIVVSITCIFCRQKSKSRSSTFPVFPTYGAYFSHVTHQTDIIIILYYCYYYFVFLTLNENISKRGHCVKLGNVFVFIRRKWPRKYIMWKKYGTRSQPSSSLYLVYIKVL